ncbi:TetR/AcrR family transcriptional regulator [Actinomadura viridis]|uniref:AcrR family transcriptional regulator n=1 Tax=Actinomadura viridis TaxID=58110 RepID=A0A931DDQ7_9ACTN|nr:TetR/AcrR family transcriptional regulator [Actinomadura viridis]MBG6087277.1 AcrR family transcriptional regulator [Actinomadura viridis]
MARPRNFDEERAVDAAMRAFWAAGYEATSTQDLCEATGLGRSSIYNTFKSKHDLFERALRHYMDGVARGQTELLEGEGTVREKVRTLLEMVVDDETGDRLGCLVVNTGVELAPRDPSIAERLRRDYEYRLGVLTGVIEAGQRAGEIDPARDARALAHFVLTTISGMRVAGRTGADREALKGIAATALGAL